MTLRYSTTARTNMMSQLNTDIGASAYVRIYSGAQPASVATAASGTLLAELRGNAGGFGTASAAALTASAITQDSSADNTGTAGYFRILKSDGTTAVIDGSVTATGGGGQLELVTTSITSGQPVSISSFVITEGNP